MWWRSDPVLLVQASEEPLAASQLASQTLWNVKKYGDLSARNSSCKKSHWTDIHGIEKRYTRPTGRHFGVEWASDFWGGLRE